MTFDKKSRAIDRRRFVPSSEGLEGRALMASANSLFGLQVANNLNVPITYEQKALRIERLPYYLEQIRPGRFIPKAEVEQIQNGLFTMMDSISKPPSAALDNFNYQLRKVVDKDSLSAGAIAVLNHGVSAVLRSANTPEAANTAISNGLLTLTSQVDTASVEPAFLGSNDNTLVLETALAIGRPMPPPQLPRIKKNEGIQADSQHIKTPLSRPTLTGTYHYHTAIEVVASDGTIVGEAACNKNNNFQVQITTPQTLGVHTFRLQAVDTVGHISKISAKFLIKIVPGKHHEVTVAKATPKGPLAKTK